MRAVIVGSVESSCVATRAIGGHPDWSLPLVVTLPPDLAHRHSDYVDLRPAAAEAGAAVVFAPDVNAPDICDSIREARPDHVFVIGWSQICRESFLAAAGDGLIGYHPAPLPRMRGRAAIPWTILAGEAITGGTLFWIDEGVDSGPILEQGFLHVAPDETAASLYARHMRLLERMMARALDSLASGNPRREVQDERFATWAAGRLPENGRLDWSAPARDIERLVRAVGRPYPGARTTLPSTGADLVIWQSQLAPGGERHLAVPGQVIARSDRAFTVMCGDGMAIEVTEWQSGTGHAPRMHAQLGRRG